MNSRSPGVGNPLTFCCWNCRRNNRKFENPIPDGRIDQVLIIGKTRKNHALLGREASSPRMRKIRVQYRCLDCGHVGWSAHVDLVNRFEQWQATIPQESIPFPKKEERNETL